MTRRLLIPTLLAARLARGEKLTVRGILTPAGLKLPTGQLVSLVGDEPTEGVLKDPRLDKADFEVGGQFEQPGKFRIDPIHTRSLFAYKGGNRLMVTYWCDICYIRTFTPSVCWCCQEWTELDLRQPDAPDPTP